MKYKVAVEHNEIKGFYVVPGYPEFLVNKFGIVLDSVTGLVLEQSLRTDYPAVNEIKVHTLMAVTFLEEPKGVPKEELLPNHINGIKQDNRLENLEWTTYSGNLLHAYKAGLRNDNTPILVKDLRTNEVIRFYSLQECARFFNVNGSIIFLYLKSGNIGKLCFEFYIMIREGMEWPDVGSELIGKHRNGSRKDLYVRDMETNKVHIFDSMSLAAEFIGLSPAGITMSLKRARSKGLLKSVNGKFELAYLDGVYLLTDNKAAAVRMRHPVKPMGPRKPRGPKRVETTDLITGDVCTYESISHLAHKLNKKKGAVQKYIHKNNGILYGKFRVRYLN